MKYIAYKRFKEQAICGDVNIPAMSECELIGPYICYNKKPVCLVTSENAHNYFFRNDDGNGMERGQLIENIRQALRETQGKWNWVREDIICSKYKRTEHKDHWLWNHNFYNADITDLKYIFNMLSKEYIEPETTEETDILIKGEVENELYE